MYMQEIPGSVSNVWFWFYDKLKQLKMRHILKILYIKEDDIQVVLFLFMPLNTLKIDSTPA
jgi:hypothetical protein